MGTARRLVGRDVPVYTYTPRSKYVWPTYMLMHMCMHMCMHMHMHM